jgi:molybdate transport system substrate-binding protein
MTTPEHERMTVHMEPSPVRLMSTLAVKKALDETILPAFQSETGLVVESAFDPTLRLLGRVAAGEPFDVIIATSESFDDLVASGTVAPATRVALARTGIGLAAAAGGPAVDLSSTASLIDALLNARSVAYSRTGASGIRFAQILDELGIAEIVNRHATIVEAGFVAEAVVDGRADIAVQQLSELLFVPAAEIIGPLPDEVQHFTEFSAAASASSVDDPGSLSLLRFLAGPLAGDAYRGSLLESIEG